MGNANNYLRLFNTREIAVIIWLLVFMAWAISKKNIRDSLFRVGKAFLNKKILSVIIAAILYASLIVFILSEIRIWETSLIKDTTFWFVGTAFVLLMNVNKATQDNGYFKKILIDSLKLVLVLEFVVNLYTFNLLIELILVPFLVAIIAMSAYAETKKEYLSFKKMCDLILLIFGIFLIFYVLAKVLGDYRSFATSENMRAFVLSPLLTFAYVPFLYLFALMMAYENLFLRIGFFVKDNKALAKVTKRKIILLCHLNLRKLNRFSRNSMQELINIGNEEDVNKLVGAFRTDRSLRKK